MILDKWLNTCDFTLELQHFVVLSKVNKRGIVIHDPAKVAVKQVSEAFTGVAIEMVPTREFKKVDERVKLPLSTFLGKVEGLWGSLGKIFFIACLLQGFILISPYYIRLVVDEGIADSQVNILWWAFAGFLMVLAISTLAQVTRSAAILFLDKTLGFQIKANIQKHLLNLPLGFFES